MITDPATRTTASLEGARLTDLVAHFRRDLETIGTCSKQQAIRQVVDAAQTLNQVLKNELPTMANILKLELRQLDPTTLPASMQALLTLSANMDTLAGDPGFENALETLQETEGSPGWRKVAFILIGVLAAVAVVTCLVLAILQAVGWIHLFKNEDNVDAKFFDIFGVAWSMYTQLWDNSEYQRVLNNKKLDSLRVIQGKIAEFTPGIVDFANNRAKVWAPNAKVIPSLQPLSDSSGAPGPNVATTPLGGDNTSAPTGTGTAGTTDPSKNTPTS